LARVIRFTLFLPVLVQFEKWASTTHRENRAENTAIPKLTAWHYRVAL
jgi:hypothetical protein